MAQALATAPPPRLSMRGVSKSFAATVALDAVDLSVAPGEVVALVGQNGAGKSTLMAILAGALAPDAGAMTLDGRPYAPRDPLEARRAGVGMIHQELSVAPHLSVMENVVLGTEPARAGFVQRDRARRLTQEVLARLGHADIPPEAVVGRLSVAEQQLVEIARAFAIGARVLVLDEPTSSLGRDDVRRLFELVRRLKADGHAVVYISHFIEEVKEVAFAKGAGHFEGEGGVEEAGAEGVHPEAAEFVFGGVGSNSQHGLAPTLSITLSLRLTRLPCKKRTKWAIK